MTARYGKAQYRPLGAQSESRMTRHDIVCAHTMVGNLTGTDTMFKKNGYGGTESHYGIGGKWGDNKDGVVYQWQDRGFTADANYDGNPRVISIETGDNAPKLAKDIEGWTPKQIDALVDLIAWECSLAAHKDCPSSWACHKGVMWEGVRVAVPPVLVPDSKSTRRGLAVHRQGVKPSAGVGKLPGYLVAGGELWSSSTGKECPGDARVRQFTSIVIPAVQARLKPKEEDDVTEKELTDAIIKVLTTEKIVANTPTARQLVKDPTLKTTYFTVASVLSNLEKQGDDDTDDARGDRSTDAETAADVKSMLAALLAATGVPIPPDVKL